MEVSCSPVGFTTKMVKPDGTVIMKNAVGTGDTNSISTAIVKAGSGIVMSQEGFYDVDVSGVPAGKVVSAVELKITDTGNTVNGVKGRCEQVDLGSNGLDATDNSGELLGSGGVDFTVATKGTGDQVVIKMGAVDTSKVRNGVATYRLCLPTVPAKAGQVDKVVSPGGRHTGNLKASRAVLTLVDAAPVVEEDANAVIIRMLMEQIASLQAQLAALLAR